MEQASFPNGGTEVKQLCGASLAQLSVCSETRGALSAQRRPLVAAVRAIANCGIGESLEHCAAALYNCSCLPEGR
jgi:hypothetical protein